MRALGRLFKVNRNAKCHSELDPWSVENDLGLYMLEELR